MLGKHSYSILFCFFFLCFFNSKAQNKGFKEKKLPPGTTLSRLKESRSVYIVTSAPIFSGKFLHSVNSNGLFINTVDPRKLNIDSLYSLTTVLFLQPASTPVDEMVINGSDLTLNGISYSHSVFPFITGKGLTVSVKENIPDTSDIDFKERFLTTGLESSTLSAHATAMATLIGGAGNTYYTGKGAAYKARLSSVTYQNLLPEHDSLYKKWKVSVQNHSYGTGIENFYGADSYAYDLSINNNDSLLHVFSAGNSGTQTSTSGKYSGVAGFANLTGSFKQSKNSLSVAATDSMNNVEILSSKGPAYDGRIKPELVAFGQDGSSGAAALVSGVSLLLQEAYQQAYGQLPSSGLVRAALINGANDIRQPGPDYVSGFGSLNAERAIREIKNNQFYTGVAVNSSSTQFNLAVPANTQELKLTLTWNDPAAMPNSTKALVNDLDLELIDATGNVIYPLVLSSFPHPDSLNAIAVQRKDTLNTVEQIVVNNPLAGNYIIRVTGSKVQGNQPFSVVYNLEAKDKFLFTYPAKNDNLLPGSTNTIRWQSFTTTSTGKLEISYDAGTNWETLNNAVPLAGNAYKAAIKDTITTAKLRMSFLTSSGTAIVLSDTFTISSRLQTTVGYNCTDSFSFYWNKLPNVTGYTVYALTDTFMRPQYQTTDTFISIHNTGYRNFAVAPVIKGKTGLRSYAFDYTQQGVGCFINSFFADPIGDSLVRLKVILGTRYQVNQVTFQRLYPLTSIVTLPADKDTLSINDRISTGGIYYYRVKLLMNNGSEIISDTVQAVIYQQRQFFAYPNPYKNGGQLILQSQDYGDSYFELFNILGEKVYSRRLKTSPEYISLPILQKGIYFYRIVQNDRRVFNGKLVVN